MFYQFFDSPHYPLPATLGRRISDDADKSKLGAYPKDWSLAGYSRSVLLLTLIGRESGQSSFGGSGDCGSQQVHKSWRKRGWESSMEGAYHLEVCEWNSEYSKGFRISHLHRCPDVFLCLASRDTIQRGAGYLVDVFLKRKRVNVLDDLVVVVRTD